MRVKAGFLSALVALTMLTGCVTQAQLNKEVSTIQNENRIKNEQIALSMGERTFDIDKTDLIKAFITTFSNKNISVINLDKEVGYMVAQGSGFLPSEKHKKAGMAEVEEMNARTSVTWHYQPGMATENFTVNLFGKGTGQIKAKVGISLVVTNPNVAAKFSEPHPAMLTALYEELWKGVDKAMFIQRNMDQ